MTGREQQGRKGPDRRVTGDVPVRPSGPPATSRPTTPARVAARLNDWLVHSRPCHHRAREPRSNGRGKNCGAAGDYTCRTNGRARTGDRDHRSPTLSYACPPYAWRNTRVRGEVERSHTHGPAAARQRGGPGVAARALRRELARTAARSSEPGASTRAVFSALCPRGAASTPLVHSPYASIEVPTHDPRMPTCV